ncbi:hypothetical protein ACOMICROBIO_GDFFDHBD_02013 [Vibrio sp. B1REV9]|uniref:DUF2076 family protein n=1 Tax=Vibrio sp. B1REV9 TaxID=2751179 RepID=UPI001AFB6FFD|nr:DUF2076 family protein [Vibrio sp. B1REV9]CAE6921639.1 hypothetical protein ACOMICROBIO_GDFFDHBD_02013 [Vibrio sp. B1REV9]
MTPQEQELIQKLAEKMRVNQNNAKDAAAAQLIQEQITSQPDIVYRLTQVALAQEVALKELKERNEYLQRNAEFYKQESNRSSLNRMFGGDKTPPPPPQPAYRPSAFSGFMQTAAGVAAGMVAGNALSHLFFGGEHTSPMVEDVTNNTIIEQPEEGANDQVDPAQDVNSQSTDTTDNSSGFLDGTDNYTQDYTGGGWSQNSGFDDNSGFQSSGFDDDNAFNDDSLTSNDANNFGGGDGFFSGDDQDFGGFGDDDSLF